MRCLFGISEKKKGGGGGVLGALPGLKWLIGDLHLTDWLVAMNSTDTADRRSAVLLHWCACYTTGLTAMANNPRLYKVTRTFDE